METPLEKSREAPSRNFKGGPLLEFFRPDPCPLSKIREPINHAPSFFKNRDALKKRDGIVRSKKTRTPWESGKALKEDRPERILIRYCEGDCCPVHAFHSPYGFVTGNGADDG